MAKRNNLFDEKIWEEVNAENKMLLEDYILELKSKGRAEKTIYQYTADIKGFFCWIAQNAGNKSILDLKKRMFRTFFLSMQEMGTSAARINRFQSSIRNLLAFAEDDEDEYDYDKNVMRAIKGIQGEKVRDIVFLTDEQIDIILEHLLEEEKYEMALYLSLSYDSAARRNEILQVKKQNFLESKMTNEVIGKRGKKFQLLYFDRTREIAKLWFDQRGNDNIDSLWVAGKGENIRARSYESLYNFCLYFRKVLELKTGEVVDINPHCFRHSSLDNYSNGTHHVLKELGKEQLDLKVLKLIAHHEDVSTTESYLMDRSEEILFEAFGI
ncbi:integrase [Enterococcus phage vipetofem]|uniref:Integrase n=1 Tax=Enterococcus phage vipetofem TaxID=2719594 RepID=A0A6G9LNP3_9CAUD|nr:integrase [Enterococcus phage vipetofem]QIQ66326.1 integrase [Enterococcus phage vipetofem]SCZ84050.1 prophage LambdaBa02, site-specific recombinase, phage integrase family [Enterococcus phage VFW]